MGPGVSHARRGKACRQTRRAWFFCFASRALPVLRVAGQVAVSRRQGDLIQGVACVNAVAAGMGQQHQWLHVLLPSDACAQHSAWAACALSRLGELHAQTCDAPSHWSTAFSQPPRPGRAHDRPPQTMCNPWPCAATDLLQEATGSMRRNCAGL